MILQRYLVKEIAFNVGATLLVLALIIVGNTFVRLLASVSNGNLPVDLLGGLLWYGATHNVLRLVPIALLIGIMLAMSKLAQNAELIALRSAGMGPKRFYKAIFWFAAPLTLIMWFAVFYVDPLIMAADQDLKKSLYERPEAAGIPTGEFVTNGPFTLLAEDIDPTQTVMQRFFIHTKQDFGETLIWARSAILFIDSLNGERFLQIRDGHRYEWDDDNQRMNLIRFDEHGIRIPLRDFMPSTKLNALPTSELTKLNTPPAIAEWQWRWAIVLSTPVLAILAFPLSYTAPRKGRFGKIALAILIYGLYANGMVTVRGLLEDGKIPPFIGMWWVHLLVLLLAGFMLWQHYGKPR